VKNRSGQRINAALDFGRNEISLYLFQEHFSGSGQYEGTSYGQTISLKKHEEGTAVQPLTYITKDCAQGLMDDLWQCGIRPTEGAGTAGSMAATNRHLEDMRVIVASKLSIALK